MRLRMLKLRVGKGRHAGNKTAMPQIRLLQYYATVDTERAGYICAPYGAWYRVCLFLIIQEVTGYRGYRGYSDYKGHNSNFMILPVFIFYAINHLCLGWLGSLRI